MGSLYGRCARRRSGSPVYLAALTHAFGAAGKRSDAQKLLADLERLSRQKYVSSVDLALAHLGLGQTAQALGLLEQAVEERSPRAAFLGIEPHLDGLRSNTRFRRLMAKIGLPVEGQTSAAKAM
jgi:hypothetical protein